MASSLHRSLIATNRTASLSTDSDTSSDYGLEFTPEEDELLNEMLLNLPMEPRLGGPCTKGNKVPYPDQECYVNGGKLQPDNSKVEGGIGVSTEGLRNTRKLARNGVWTLTHNRAD
jgi:hypothetical protein